MNDPIIRARDLRKVYRLYRKPAHRFLDMFGLLRGGAGAYSEHAALDGVSLEIARGEKVAFIGRNGAGKSTFLKLVTGVIEPTSGALNVRGRAHALLQIGTGFHPDFTGRQNVHAYLAQLGVPRREAERLCHDIVEFAELEEYIDQPVKTYSTGMGVRLMFATSTAITPDLLVLDEVLGVGDAYFANKSFERIRWLCEREGTSLLLVTHDIYSAIKICPRAVWFDSGRVLMDGDSTLVVRAYEDSVRQQEERRLRVRKQARLREAGKARGGEQTPFLLEIRARENRPLPSTIHIRHVALRVGDRTPVALPLGESAFEETNRSHLQQEGTAWGPAAEIDGVLTRPFLNYGTSFHRVVGVFVVPDAGPAVLGQPFEIELSCRADSPCDLSLNLYSSGGVIDLGPCRVEPGTWQVYRFFEALPSAKLVSDAIAGNAAYRHGSGAISVTDVQSVAPDGTPTHLFVHGQPFELHIHHHINDPRLDERAQVIVTFHRNGVDDVFRVITRDLVFNAKHPDGTIVLLLPHLPLAVGSYTVTVLIAEEGYYDREQTLFYSINPGVYAALSKVLDIAVEGGGIVATGTAVVGEGAWRLTPAGAS